MSDIIRSNYETLKKEMRRLLKSDMTEQESLYVNKQVEALNTTLKDINGSTFDMDMSEKLDQMYVDFLPLMFSYWMVNNVEF